MNLEKYPRLGICGVLAWLIVVIAMASTASAEWKEKVLYSFQGGASDGSVPAGGVVFDKQGNLYGATSDGGGVYQLAPPATKGGAWTESVLYVFKGNTSGDGATPTGGLVIDSAGNLYGTTAYGGTGNCVLLGTLVGCGTVYELSPPMTKGGPWAETVLYSFPTAKQGYYPRGDLVFDDAGNLYGATIFGGGKGTTCDPFYQYCGAVFELSPPKSKGGKWREKVLHGFKSGTDGASPNGGLVLDTKGAIYGTTFGGGNEVGECGAGGCGTAFKLTPPIKKGGAWTERVLYRFSVQDGAAPAAGVIFGGDGNLYGTAYAGANSGNGVVFELRRPSGNVHSWTEAILYRFTDGDDGTSPEASLIFDVGGNLYGTALGGRTHRGVVFRLRPPKRANSWLLTVLYNFTGVPDGDHPVASLIFDGRENLYSTTGWGGAGQSCQGGCGAVFEVSP